ncbi:unnamed protein product [Ectocarpus sp. 4 AP-2014]
MGRRFLRSKHENSRSVYGSRGFRCTALSVISTRPGEHLLTLPSHAQPTSPDNPTRLVVASFDTVDKMNTITMVLTIAALVSFRLFTPLLHKVTSKGYIETFLRLLWQSTGRKERLAIGDRPCGNNAPSPRGRVVTSLTAKACKTLE